MTPLKKTPTKLLDKMRFNTRQAKDDRLAILAVELGIAGAQVLQEDFGFTQQMAAIWLDKMLDKAKVNRGAELARQAVEAIDGDKATER